MGEWMMCSCDSLESEFLKFKEKNKDSNSTEHVEFIGINLSNELYNKPVFKAYYTTAKSMENIPDLLKTLEKKQMIRAINRIDDTVNQGCVRYEIGLKNRTNRNMDFIYKWLYSICSELQSHRNEIERLCSIKCTNLNDYQYAALYFIGLIADVTNQYMPMVRAIKLYYLLRQCSNPEKIGENYTINNYDSFQLLYSLQIPEIEKIVLFIQELLKKNTGELLMTAVDYYENGFSKYKIYIKGCSKNIFEHMIKKFEISDCEILAKRIHSYAKWIKEHPELECYGIAICLDSSGGWSVNIYH